MAGLYDVAMVDPEERRAYWNERYATEGCLFGIEANMFVVEHLGDLAPGRTLDLGCGQGRNAVWLAMRGHTVTAMDLSDTAIEQTGELASQAGVTLDLVVADATRWEPDPDGFDLVLLSYLQLEEARRVVAHRKVIEALAPGGTVFLIAHHKDNIEHGIGGPQRPEVLFDEAELAADFAGLEILRNGKVHRNVERNDVRGTAIDVLMIATRS